MTNEEAIKQIVAYVYFNIEDIPEEVEKAFDLAIKALRKVDCIYLKDECSFACGECGYCEAEKGGEEE